MALFTGIELMPSHILTSHPLVDTYDTVPCKISLLVHPDFSLLQPNISLIRKLGEDADKRAYNFTA